MKILETKRLALRLYNEADTEALTEMYADIDVMRYVGTGKLLTREDAVKSVNFWNNYHAKKGYANWAVEEKSTGRFIGKCGLDDVPELGQTEVSYMFGKASWGKGYATESAEAVLEFGLRELKFEKLMALTYAENFSSQNVLKKIGMVYTDDVEVWGVMLRRFSS